MKIQSMYNYKGGYINTFYVTTECCGKEYEHGQIKIVKRDDYAQTLEVELNLVVSHTVQEFRDELEKLIRKYAI